MNIYKNPLGYTDKIKSNHLFIGGQTKLEKKTRHYKKASEPLSKQLTKA